MKSGTEFKTVGPAADGRIGLSVEPVALMLNQTLALTITF